MIMSCSFDPDTGEFLIILIVLAIIYMLKAEIAYMVDSDG